MANQNYSEFSTRRQNKNSAGPGVTAKKGSPGAEHDSAHKDTVTGWPSAPGPRSPSMCKDYAIVKTSVVCDGVDCGGNSHYK